MQQVDNALTFLISCCRRARLIATVPPSMSTDAPNRPEVSTVTGVLSLVIVVVDVAPVPWRSATYTAPVVGRTPVVAPGSTDDHRFALQRDGGTEHVKTFAVLVDELL